MKFLRFSLLLVAASTLLGSCLKKNYDNPPDTSQFDPNLPVQSNIKFFSESCLELGSGKSRIMGDTTISGIIVADDKTGNLYKQFVIQDGSEAGIVVYIDKSYLYNDFPAGRKIYIKLKGLTLANYRGLPEIVYSADALGNTTAIPYGLINNYIVKASYPNVVTPKNVTIEDIRLNASKYINTLVTITDAQFITAHAGATYASPSSIASGTDRTIENCARDANLTVRTSGYSTLQPFITPTGHGSLTCIVSYYSSSPQLLIRDTSDVKMPNARCN